MMGKKDESNVHEKDEERDIVIFPVDVTVLSTEEMCKESTDDVCDVNILAEMSAGPLDAEGEMPPEASPSTPTAQIFSVSGLLCAAVFVLFARNI